MTIHGPLTSMALGRSPYDDVVMGEGEGDPRAPLQVYDERARPVNPETRRINRDIIRAHNEVMQVIGVVEPEESKEEVVAERARRIEHAQHDNRLGLRFNVNWRFYELGGVWGLGGIRQRIFLYKEYSHVPFWQPLQDDPTRSWPARLFLDGLPAFMVGTALNFSCVVQRTRNYTILQWGRVYVQTMLKTWLVLRRTDLLPASASHLFPSWKWFVPFTDSSPIPPCPPPASLNLHSVASWLGSVALGVGPIVALWSIERVFRSLRDAVQEEVYDILPHPSSPGQPSAPNHELVLQNATTNADEPVQSQTQSGPVPLAHSVEAIPVRVPSSAPQGHTHADGNFGEAPQSTEAPAHTDAGPDAVPVDGSTTPPTRPPNGGSRHDGRRPSNRTPHPQNTEADDFTSDDEETEVVSATLISFDVENNPENPDPNDSNIPPGVWSAELRPNPGNDSQSVGAGHGDSSRRPPRLYRTNELTQLPANLAARLFARRIVSFCFAPLEASAVREVALLWCRTRGLSTASMWEPTWLWPFTLKSNGLGFSFWAGFSQGTLLNLAGVEVIHMLLDFAIWTRISLYSTKFVMSSSEWDEQAKERQERKQQQEQLAAANGATDARADLGAATRGSNRRSNGPTHVMEALWEDFETAVVAETYVVQHEFSPLFDGSSLRLRHWTLRVECWRRGEADSVRELLQCQPFLVILVTEFDRRLQEMKFSMEGIRSGGSPGEGTSSEGFRSIVELAPPIREAVLHDTDYFGVQALVHGEGDYLRSVRDTLRSWRQGALSPRAVCITNQLLVALWLQLGYQYSAYVNEGGGSEEAPTNDFEPSSAGEASTVADAAVGGTIATPPPSVVEVEVGDTSASVDEESPDLFPGRRYIDQVLLRI